MTSRSRLAAACFALCAFGLLAWALVRAITLFASPSAVAEAAVQTRSAPDVGAARAVLADAALFGEPAPAAAEASPPQTRLKLLGLYAAPGRSSYAVLVVDNGKPEVAAEGVEIRPGVVLQEVRPDHAVVRQRGRLERLELPATQAGR